ncbi:MAG: hypothetical protein SGI88_19580 [Candidatus Hydrogenedentes bacterium]|nr:hypothetical protein [Candidatus Hydrogenedentota bacterium]
MQCQHIRLMLQNYALDDARTTERLCVDVHVSHCAACRRELEDVCELILASDRALAHPSPRDDFDGLMARIAADEAALRETQVKIPFRWRTVALRASAVAVVAAVLVFTPPLVRQTGQVVNGLREAAHAQPGDTPVPVLTEPFVSRMQAVTRGGVSEIEPSSRMTQDTVR